MAGNFPNLLKNINLYIHKAQQMPYRIRIEIHRHQSENAESQRQEENLESSKSNMTHHLERNLNKIG